LPLPHVALVLLSVVLQYVSPAPPGQHAVAPPVAGFAKHDPDTQQMSVPMFAHVPGCPPVALGAPVHRPAFVTHWPVVVLHTWLVPHCESSVHLPHVLGPPAPQTVPFEFVVQSAFVQQLPGTHAFPPVPAQQKSAGFTHAVPAALQPPATQR
jgi:hypothetical protein